MNPQSTLPNTPAEVLDLSPGLLEQVEAGVKAAEDSGQWIRPYKEAATAAEEMGPMDILYWAFKCTNPITKMEEGVENLLLTDSSIVGLPEGFEKKNTVTMGLAGDLLQADGLELSKGILYENVADILFDKDISYANFESPITNQPLVKEVIGDKGPPIECCNREQFEVLAKHKDKKFTVLNTSNNHMFDMGLEGVQNTLSVLSEEGILDVGTNRKPEEYGKGKFLTCNGIKIGFASVTFGLNGHVVPEEEAYRINTSKLHSKLAEPDFNLIKQQIDDCKKQECDFIVTSLHWGFEFEMMPREQQVLAARALVEYGADAVVCHHPHVIQPVEYYQTQRDPNRVATIAYSLGSVVWGFKGPHLALSAIQNLTLAKGNFDGQELTYIEEADVTPVFRSAVDRNGKTETRIEKLQDHLNGQSDRHPDEYIEKINSYARLVL